MFKRIHLFIFAFLFFFTQAVLAGPTANVSPVGYWKTIDDVSGKPKAILEITQRGGTLQGRVVKTFTSSNICTACTGDKRNKPIVGMVILEDLKQRGGHPTEWTDGQILDPKTGKIYHCSLKVIDNGRRVTVRGYVGLPLFGRTQTWVRVSGP